MAKLHDLTRTCILSGISATQWSLLVQKWTIRVGIPQINPNEVLDAFRPLLSTQSSEGILPQYISIAISSQMLSLDAFAIWILTPPFIGSSLTSFKEFVMLDNVMQEVVFNQLARQSSTQHLITISDSTSVDSVIQLAHNAIDLVKFVFSVPSSLVQESSPLSRTLRENSTSLLVQILESIGNVDLVSSSEATGLLSHLNEIAHLSMSSTTIAPLAHWSNQLTTLSLNDVGSQGGGITDISAMWNTPIPEPNMPRVITSDPADILPKQEYGMATEGSGIACSIVLQRLITEVPGAGDSRLAVARLLCLFISLDSNPEVFFSGIFTSCLRILALYARQGSPSHAHAQWKAFVMGRLPVLLKQVRDIMQSQELGVDLGTIISSSLNTTLDDSTLLEACDPPIPTLADSMLDDVSKSHPNFKKHLLYSFRAAELLDGTLLRTGSPDMAQEYDRITANQDQTLMLEAHIASKLDVDCPDDQTEVFLEEAVSSYASHAVTVDTLEKLFDEACTLGDLRQLSHISRMLYSNMWLMELVVMHKSLVSILDRAIKCLGALDFGSQGDAQTALNQYGAVVLLLQICMHRFKIKHLIIPILELNGLSADAFVPSSAYLPLASLVTEDRSLAKSWSHSIFSPASDGIGDELLRTTGPTSLLRLAPTVLIEAVREHATPHGANRDALLNGVSYFVGDLLNWTLPSIILSLVSEIEREGAAAGIYMEVLFVLTSAPGCPPPALQIAGYSILRLLVAPHIQSIATVIQRDLTVIRTQVQNSLFIPSGHPITSPPSQPSSLSHADVPRYIVRAVFGTQQNQPCNLPLRRLHLFQPRDILDSLFFELRNSLITTPEGVTILPRSALIITSCVLTSPRSSKSSSLISYTFKVFAPTTLVNISDGGLPRDVDVLALMLEICIRSLRQLRDAEEIVAEKIFATPNAEEFSYCETKIIDLLVDDFVRWLGTPGAPAIRAQLLQKLRALPDWRD